MRPLTTKTAAQIRVNVKRALRRQLDINNKLFHAPTQHVALALTEMSADDYLLENLYRIASRFDRWAEYANPEQAKTEYLEARDLTRNLIHWVKNDSVGLTGAWDAQALAINSCHIDNPES